MRLGDIIINPGQRIDAELRLRVINSALDNGSSIETGQTATVLRHPDTPGDYWVGYGQLPGTSGTYADHFAHGLAVRATEVARSAEPTLGDLITTLDPTAGHANPIRRDKVPESWEPEVMRKRWQPEPEGRQWQPSAIAQVSADGKLITVDITVCDPGIALVVNGREIDLARLL